MKNRSHIEFKEVFVRSSGFKRFFSATNLLLTIMIIIGVSTVIKYQSDPSEQWRFYAALVGSVVLSLIVILPPFVLLLIKKKKKN